MTKDKKDDAGRQTKAGMMEKNSSRISNGNDEAETEKEPENTPKISKEKAEKRDTDKPLH